MLVGRLFSGKWIVATILSTVAIGVMVRLGIWQLDRLEQRRAFNAQVLEQVQKKQLVLTGDNLLLNLTSMEYRKVLVRGRYDFSQEVALRNQVWNDQIGVHLLTPLRISGSDQTVIVDRGWIPQEAYLTGEWSAFAESGDVEIEGIIRMPQSKADFGNLADPTAIPGERLDSWNLANIEQMSKQMSYPILPVYVQQFPEENRTKMPYRMAILPELSEGSHMSYAIQWFAFAAILAVGYPVYVKREQQRKLVEGFDVIRKAENTYNQ